VTDYTTQVQAGNKFVYTDYYLSKGDYNSLHVFTEFHSLSDNVQFLWYSVPTDLVARLQAQTVRMIHHLGGFCILHCCGQPWQW
jgi:hypothetical protein